MASSNKATSTSVNDGTPGDVGLFDDTVSSNESESGWQTYSDDEKCECEECVEDNVQFRKEDDSVGCGPPAPLAPMTTEPTLHGFRKGFLLSPKGKKKRETAPVKAQSTATYVSSPNNDDNGLKLPARRTASAELRQVAVAVASSVTTQHPAANASTVAAQGKKEVSPPIGSASAGSERRPSASANSERPLEQWPCNFAECNVRLPISATENYFQISCLSDCMLRLHPECFKSALAKQNIDSRKKKNIKKPSCITPDCGASMYEIYEHHINEETTLYKRCCEAPPPPVEKKPEPARKNSLVKLPKDFFASMRGDQRANSIEMAKDVDNNASFEPIFDMRPVEPKKGWASWAEEKADAVALTPPPNIAAVPLKREEDLDLKYKIAEGASVKKKTKKSRDKPKPQLLPTEFRFTVNDRMELNYSSSTEFVGGGGAAYAGGSRPSVYEALGEDGRALLDEFLRTQQMYSLDTDDFGVPFMDTAAAKEAVATGLPRHHTKSSKEPAHPPNVPDIADRAVQSHMQGEVDRILPEIRPILTEIASELCIMGVPVSVADFGQMVCSRTGRLWLADQQTVAEIVNSGYTDLLVNRSQLFRFDAQKSLVSALEDINRSPSPLADGDCESGIGDDDDSGKAVLAHALDYLSKRALDDVVGGAFKTPTTSSIVEVRTATVVSGNEQGSVSQHADESSDSDDNAQVDVREQLRSATAKLEEDLVAEKDRITQMKRQYKVELDAVMDEKTSLETKVTELNGKVASAQSKEREQLKKVAALEKEVKELKERLSKVNGGGSDSAELKRQNDDLREQLRAVELSHNENDRSHRAVISRYSNRAEHAEKALLTIKCEVESRSLQRKLQDAEYNVGHTQLIVERIRTQGASNADLLAWLTYNNEWKRIATIISASIDNIKTEYAVMIEAIGSGRKTLSNFSPVKVPETPLPPSMPPLPFNVATPDLPPSSINNLRSFAPSIPPPSQAIRPVTGTPPGLERQHFVQPQQELERPSSRGSSLTTTAAQPQKESSGAAGGSTAAGGGRDKLQKLIAEVKRKLPDVDEKTVTSAMGKLRKDKWNGALPKNMRVIIAEVVQYLTDASQSERTTAWVTAQAASSAPRDSRAILARGHECKICLMPCLNAQDLSACSACNEPYHRPCVNQWLQQSTGTGDCPNCRKPWLSPEDFPSLH